MTDHAYPPSALLDAHHLDAIHRTKGMAFPMSGDKRRITEGREKRVRGHYANYRKGAA